MNTIMLVLQCEYFNTNVFMYSLSDTCAIAPVGSASGPLESSNPKGLQRINPIIDCACCPYRKHNTPRAPWWKTRNPKERKDI